MLVHDFHKATLIQKTRHMELNILVVFNQILLIERYFREILYLTRVLYLNKKKIWRSETWKTPDTSLSFHK